ncbi:MAG: hypothetical protein AB7H77_03810 [Bdellovibrionales bacterium]
MKNTERQNPWLDEYLAATDILAIEIRKLDKLAEKIHKEGHKDIKWVHANILSRAATDVAEITKTVQTHWKIASRNAVPNPPKETKMDKTIKKIAETILDLETLETRKSDSLDFKEQSVWSIKWALEAAYLAGQQSKKQ